MKAEDVRLLWRIASLEACGVESGYDPPDELMLRFARACEKRGIERAKASVVEAEVTTHPRYRLTVERSVDWSALDAEVAEENADG